MNFLKSLFGSTTKPEQPEYKFSAIDLGYFQYDQIQINFPFPNSHYLYEYLNKNESYLSDPNGFEVGIKNGKLNYIFLILEQFNGQLQFKGSDLDFNSSTNIDEVTKMFGEPYWVDSSDGETIQFYIYDQGNLELQFEYTNKVNLSFITLSYQGVLFSPEQRKSYEVNKPWPPQNN